MKRNKLFCGFCQSSKESKITGPLLNKDDVVAHQNCMFYSSNIVNKNTPDDDDLMGFLPEDVKEEIKRGSRLRCAKCRKIGATVGCEVKKCRRSYHYPCAVMDNAENIEDDDQGIYKIYCVLHKMNGDSDGSYEAMKRKRPPFSPRSAKRRILDDSSASDENQNSVDDELAPLESDLEDTRDLRENLPDSDVLERNLTMNQKDEPQPSTSGVFQHKVAKNGTKSTPKPPRVMENKTKSSYQLERTCRIELPKCQVTKKQVHHHNGEEDETDIDSDQESESLLVPLKFTRVSINLDHSGTSTHDQQSDLPLLATPRSPETEPAAICGSLSTNSQCSPWKQAGASSSKTGAQGASGAAEFWRKCREAGCVEAIFRMFTSAMDRMSERIVSDKASEEDYALSLRVLEASEMLPEIFGQQDKQYEVKLLALQKEMEAVKKSRAAARSAGRMKSPN